MFQPNQHRSSKTRQAAIVPVLRRSGVEGSLVSRLWQRSPRRHVSDEAFSRPSSSTTTQRAVRPADATVGTRKPGTQHQEAPVGLLRNSDHIQVEMGCVCVFLPQSMNVSSSCSLVRRSSTSTLTTSQPSPSASCFDWGRERRAG